MRSPSRRRGLANVVAALMMLAMLFTVGTSYFLLVSQANQQYANSLVNRSNSFPGLVGENLLVTTLLLNNNHIAFYVNNTAGLNVNMTAVLVLSSTGSVLQCDGRGLPSGSGCSNTTPTLPIVVNAGKGSATIDTGFTYVAGTADTVKIVSLRGNAFTATWPATVPPYATQAYSVGSVTASLGSFRWLQPTGNMQSGYQVGGYPTVAISPFTTNIIPITLTNNQGSATPITFQQKITWNPSSYQSYEASDLGNVRFCADSACATALNAWLESCTPSCIPTATSASAWVRLTSSIAGGGGTQTIYMTFQSLSTDFDANYWGEAPTLSGTYAAFDNGGNTFNFYDNFAGTSLSMKWTLIKSSGGTVTVNNGATFATSASTDYGFVSSTAQTYPQVAESYMLSSGSVNPLLGVSTTQNIFTAISSRYVPITLTNYQTSLVPAIDSSTCVPITITNSQSSATPNPFEQKVTINPSTYQSSLKSDLGNIRFYSDSACSITQLNAWLESCTPSCTPTATSANAWVKLTSSIPASGGTLKIYMSFLSTSTPFDGNFWGEAPTLSGSYGQYDNGANVFKFYDNFAGTSLSSKWTTVSSTGAATLALDGSASAAGSGSSSIAIDATSTSTTNTDASGHVTISFTVGTGTNRLLILGGTVDNNAITGVTYAGTALTQAVADTQKPFASIWYLVNPPSGTANVVVTSTALKGAVIGVISFTGVDQTTPVPTTAKNDNVGGVTSPATVSITNANANAWVMDVAGSGNSAGLTNGASTTQRWSIAGSANSGASSTKGPLAANTVTNFSWTLGTADAWDDVAVEIKPAAGGTAGTVSVSLTTTVANDVIYVVVGADLASGTINVPTATGLTFTQRGSTVSSTGSEVAAFYAIATTSGTRTITATTASANGIAIVAFGVSGANTASPFDTHAGIPATATGTGSSASVTMSTTNANDFIIGGFAGTQGTAGSAGSGFTLIQTVNAAGNTNNFQTGSEDKIVSSAQTNLAVTFTLTTASNWQGIADAIVSGSTPNCTVAVNNGATFTTPSSTAWCFVAATQIAYPTVSEAYMVSSGSVNPMMGVSTSYSANAAALGNGLYNGYAAFWNSGTNTRFALEGSSGYTLLATRLQTTFPAGIWQVSWSATGSEYFQDAAGNSYTGTDSGVTIANNGIYVGQSTNAAGSNVVDWGRMRAYPPSNTMPSVSIASVTGTATAQCSTATTCALTLTTFSTNDVIYVGISDSAGGNKLTGVSDTSGLAWTQRKYASSTSIDVYAYYAVAASILPSDSITATTSAATTIRLIAIAISKANTASPFDPNLTTAPTGSGTSSNPATVTFSTFNANDMIIGTMMEGSTQNPTGAAGYTSITCCSGGVYAALEYQAVTAAGSYTPSFTLGANDAWAEIGDAVQGGTAAPTPNPFQQKIVFNPSTYSTYEGSALGNIRFCVDSLCATTLYAWLESCTPSCTPSATSATVWVKLTSAIAGAGGTLTIYMDFLTLSTNFDGNFWGEAPNLSGSYGQYDNGANVFTFYDNFAGTSLSSKWTTVGSTGTTNILLDGSATAQFSTASSGTVTLTTTTANDVIVVLATNEDATNSAIRTVSSVTATGLTFTKRSSLSLGSPTYQDTEVWWAIASSALSAKVITVTLSGSTDDAALVAFGVSGANTASPWDPNVALPATATGNPATTPTVSGVSTSNANDMILGFQGNGNGAAVTSTSETAGSGFTLIANINNNGAVNADDAAAEYKIVSATQSSISVPFGTATTANNYWMAIADAIQAATTGGCTVAVNNGATFTTSTSSDWCFVYSAQTAYPSVAESYMVSQSASGVEAMLGVSTTTSTNSHIALYAGYDLDYFAGSDKVNVNVAGSRTILQTITQATFPAGIWTATWAAGGSEYFVDGAGNAYTGTDNTAGTIANYRIFVGQSNNAAGNDVIRWGRMRAFPPNNVMPSTSFGSVGGGTTGITTLYNGYNLNWAGGTDKYGVSTVSSYTVLSSQPQASFPAGIWAVTWSATGSEYFQDGAGLSYTGLDSSVSIANYGIYVGQTSLAAGNNVVQWARMRAYPPGNVMPATSFGTLSASNGNVIFSVVFTDLDPLGRGVNLWPQSSITAISTVSGGQSQSIVVGFFIVDGLVLNGNGYPTGIVPYNSTKPFLHLPYRVPTTVYFGSTTAKGSSMNTAALPTDPLQILFTLTGQFDDKTLYGQTIPFPSGIATTAATTFSAASGGTSTTVTVSGANFRASTKSMIGWIDSTGKITTLTTFTTTAGGGFSGVTFQVPSASAGYYTIIVSDYINSNFITFQHT